MPISPETSSAKSQIKLLMTMPGVDFTVAQTLLSALGDISRFPSADQAASYLGLVPSTYQSGEHCFHGHITKQGRGHARWMLVQAAQHLDKHPGPLGVFFRRIARKKNRNVAVVAAARKLVTTAWHMLKNDEPYRYSIPSITEAKFAKLRIRATGAKKKGGLKKGSPRTPQYGKGRTKAVPALSAVYASENLPGIAEPKPGISRRSRETRGKRAGRPAMTRFVSNISEQHQCTDPRPQRRRIMCSLGRPQRRPAACS